MFKALDNVSFNVEQGKSYGIIGQNGSGKSTLLRLISNNAIPTSGSIESNGVVSLLNVGVGISDNYTGIQNIYYKCALNGMSKLETDQVLDKIIEFSELADFIYQPVRKYSSGMRAKLGFAIAIYCEFDILIIDEALAVGDERFKNKCLKKMSELKSKGKTMLFVSHSSHMVKQFCERCCWLHKGELIAKGKVADIVELYSDYMANNISLDMVKRVVDYDKGIYYED